MKTNFALGLTQDGITLWQRDTSGWLRVGAVALDNPDMDTAMAAIMDKARKLSPDGLTTKLVVPDEHLLKTTLHAPGPGRDAQEAQIRAGLAGRTPFPVEELVFDWSGAGSTVNVIVVARETLIEAEEFAASQGLNPVTFVAATATDEFRGEPFFGLTRQARAKRIDPTSVVRDTTVLRETGIARLPEPPAPVAAPVVTPVVPPAATPIAPSATSADTALPDTTATTPKDAPKPASSAAVATPKTQQGAPGVAEKPVTDKPVADKPAVIATKTDAPSPDAKPAPATMPSTAPTSGALNRLTSASIAPDLPKPDTAASDTTATFGFRTRRQGTTPAPTAPVSSALRPSTAATPPLLTEKPAALAPEALSRMGQSLRDKYSQTNTAVTTKVKALRTALSRGQDATVAWPQSATARDTGKAGASAVASPTPQSATPPARSSAFSALVSRVGKGTSKPPVTAPTQLQLTTSAPTRTDPLTTLRNVQDKASGATQNTTSADEAKRLTVFGARGTSVDLGKPPLPRQALLISGGVLLILISAAIWALYFSTASTDQAQAPSVAPSALDVAAPAPLADEPALSDEATDLAAIEAALGQSDAAQADRVAEDGSEGGFTEDADAVPDALPLPGAGEGIESALTDAPSDPVQAPPTDGAAGRVAEIRSNGIVAPQEQSGLLPDPVPPAPFGADPLPPLRGSAEAQALLDQPGAADVEPVPADSLGDDIANALTQDLAPADTVGALPTGEEALTIDVTNGPPPSTPPAKPARFSQPEAPAPAPLPETGGTDQDATAPILPASPTEQELDIRVTAGPPAAVPPRRADQPAATPQPDSPQTVTALGDAAPVLPTRPSEQDLQIRVTAGTPAAVPPRRANQPATTVPPDVPQVTAEQGARAELPPPTDTADATPNSDQDAELIVAAAFAAPPPPGGVALSSFRPAARPSDLRLPVETPVPAEPEFPNATAQAVESSVRPNSRPAQFAQVVQRALSAAAPRTATTAPPAVEAIQTASAAAAMPALPTSTSVAREATQARAINLRQVNLLGVMGTSTNRRALVRLSNGRVVTVRVGEGLDDGQVTAIGDSELRYVRRGRDVVLRIAS